MAHSGVNQCQMNGCITGFTFLYHPGCSPLKSQASKSPRAFFYTLKTSFLSWGYLPRGHRTPLDSLLHLSQHSQPISWLTWRMFLFPSQLNFLPSPLQILLCCYSVMERAEITLERKPAGSLVWLNSSNGIWAQFTWWMVCFLLGHSEIFSDY